MMLIYKGYTYTHMTHNTRWYCSKKAGGCRARLKTTSEGQLVQVLESEHNHPPPNLYRAASGKIIKVMQVKNIDVQLEIIPSNRSSGHLLVHDGYTFVSMNSKTRWYCSKKKVGCKAKLIVTPEGKFVEMLGHHDHLPPNLYRVNGQVFKV
ncbi:uncharacterized protein LOC123868962 isoform X1 [Maniola jurtina]|uniref:uncharacterized protein LOC123868962 isoform X1 n=1 Tax=Maniola jurtina TaxID=191418 RepID=UPI001E68AFC8|nr:uncharacterized protein LOC123868962 isoform X1 [Maniola jurtina]